MERIKIKLGILNSNKVNIIPLNIKTQNTEYYFYTDKMPILNEDWIYVQDTDTILKAIQVEEDSIYCRGDIKVSKTIYNVYKIVATNNSKLNITNINEYDINKIENSINNDIDYSVLVYCQYKVLNEDFSTIPAKLTVELIPIIKNNSLLVEIVNTSFTKQELLNSLKKYEFNKNNFNNEVMRAIVRNWINTL